jgi:vacuolar-type H+-ATPase subunit H
MSQRTGQTAENKQSLLGAIRQKESTITRQLAAARDAAEKEVEAAEKQARQMVHQAAEDGRLEGEAARRSRLEEIEQEAAEIEARAWDEAGALNNMDEDTLAAAVNQALNLITGNNKGNG